uniref:transposase n=1 Tax=Changchengzhania lutea TaxID=2049305 RepID=UPI001FECF6E4|nr:transposase [Changchengzhania lutea]
MGYLENIISDRDLISHCSLCLDILYFLGYDIDEELPWHSTISRTLTQFLGLRKINTLGIKQANKVMHLSAIAYNLKKYLKFTQKRVKSGAGMLMVVQRLPLLAIRVSP